MAQDSSLICYDWILHSGNVHYARDRSIFSTYVSISAEAQTSVGSRFTIAGMGTISIEVLREPDSTETMTLNLRNVLHLPNSKCNGFSLSRCAQAFPNLVISFANDAHRTLVDKASDKGICYGIPFAGLSKLALADTLVGDSPFAGDDSPKMMSVYMEQAELEKCIRAHMEEVKQVDV